MVLDEATAEWTVVVLVLQGVQDVLVMESSQGMQENDAFVAVRLEMENVFSPAVYLEGPSVVTVLLLQQRPKWDQYSFGLDASEPLTDHHNIYEN